VYLWLQLKMDVDSPSFVLKHVIVSLKVTSQLNSVCNFSAKEELSVLILLYWTGRLQVCVIVAIQVFQTGFRAHRRNVGVLAFMSGKGT